MYSSLSLLLWCFSHKGNGCGALISKTCRPEDTMFHRLLKVDVCRSLLQDWKENAPQQTCSVPLTCALQEYFLVSDSIATRNQICSDPTLILCFINDRFRNLCFPKKQSFRLMFLNPVSYCSMAPLDKPGQCLGGVSQ